MSVHCPILGVWPYRVYTQKKYTSSEVIAQLLKYFSLFVFLLSLRVLSLLAFVDFVVCMIVQRLVLCLSTCRFAINLEADNGDIVMHCNPRFAGTNAVVRNTLQRKSWGHEERHGQFPFRIGQPFEVTITIEEPFYKVCRYPNINNN